MVKEQILQTALQQYEKYGIKGVSMNEIAGKLRISKKTIYCEFRSKEEIITESLLRKLDEGNREINRVIKKSTNALEALVWLGYGIGDSLSRICPAFFKDLSRFPEAYSQFMACKDNLDKELTVQFRTGVKEGLLRREEDYEMIVKIYMEQLQSPATPYKAKVIHTFLRGICTPEGIQLLDTFK